MLSRVAEQLYWMARYLERAQNLARRLNVMTVLAADTNEPDEAWSRLQGQLGEDARHFSQADDVSMLQHLVFESTCEVSVHSCVRQTRDNARMVRDIVSREIWHLLSRMKAALDGPQDVDGQDENACGEALTQITLYAHAIEGLIDSTILRDEGYYWLQVGVWFERTMSTLQLLLAYGDVWQSQIIEPTTAMAILKSVTSYGAFRRAYRTSLGSRDILEFLLFEREFPRSVAGGLSALQSAIGSLPQPTQTVRQSVGRVTAQVDYDGLEQVEGSSARTYLWNLHERMAHIHGELSLRYFEPEVVEI